jgi:hypothetical protein
MKHRMIVVKLIHHHHHRHLLLTQQQQQHQQRNATHFDNIFIFNLQNKRIDIIKMIIVLVIQIQLNRMVILLNRIAKIVIYRKFLCKKI